MPNIIICDDDIKFRKSIISQIKKYMENNKFDYNIYEYLDYNTEFMNILKQELSDKIYILDIETPTRSGIDIARIIRKTDVDSPIIFLTGHEELGGIVLSKDLNFLAFINKFDNYAKRLNNSLNMAMKLLNKKCILRFNDRGSIYSLKCDNILYITTDTVSRKSIIVTDKHEYNVNLTLNSLLELLNDDFIRTHKSCIVNKTRISNINNNKNIIIFDNGKEIDLLSSKYKKEIDLNV